MAKTLEQRAQRFVDISHEVTPGLLRSYDKVITSGDRITDYDNSRDPGAELDTEKAILMARFTGCVALQALRVAIPLSRLMIATRRFHSNLVDTQPHIIDTIRDGDTDYYSVAAEMFGINPAETADIMFKQAGLQKD